MDPEERSLMRGPYVGKDLTFTEIIGARTCRSSNEVGVVGFPYLGIRSFHRGVWAGHRFEITTLDSKRQAPDGKEWRDAGEEVMENMAELWYCIHNERWVDRL